MILSKYSASGNDFVIFHTFIKEDRKELAKKLCHRHNGVGADGLIVILPHQKHDFEWQFYNSDGSEANMCGNGSRAVAHYAFSNGIVPQREMSFLTGAGVIGASVDGDMVLSELTPPIIINKNINQNDKCWQLVDTGVPHLVHFTDNIEFFDIEEARELRQKYNANVNIAFVDGKNLRVRTYERGVENETLACGTGMAACFFVANENGMVSDNIEVYPASNEILYLGRNEKTITFKGEVKKVFEVSWLNQ